MTLVTGILVGFIVAQLISVARTEGAFSMRMELTAWFAAGVALIAFIISAALKDSNPLDSQPVVGWPLLVLLGSTVLLGTYVNVRRREMA